eukprot:2131068-Prorocentrum_lima.AAC.1
MGQRKTTAFDAPSSSRRSWVGPGIMVSFLTRYDTDIGIDRQPSKPIRYGKMPPRIMSEVFGHEELDFVSK